MYIEIYVVYILSDAHVIRVMCLILIDVLLVTFRVSCECMHYDIAIYI